MIWGHVFRPPRFVSSALAFIHQHERLLWGLHSLWALALGIVVMWAGSRNYAWIRYTVLYIGFLWVASLFVPDLVDPPGGASRWRGRLRLVVNYFSKNFYQQLLFFLLPIYWASATGWSINVVFVFVLAISALLSTFDVVFDRHLSVHRGLTAVFFAFNLFACINVMLPLLWSISGRLAMPVSAALAVLAFATIRFRLGELAKERLREQVGLAAMALVLVVAIGRPLIPPVPLRVLATEFGQGINRRTYQVTRQLDQLPAGWSGTVFAVTSIYAPLGLSDRIGHRWYQDDRLIWASPFYSVQGGRKEGFRLWTSAPASGVQPGSRVRVEVWTEAGQLVGRADLETGTEG
jgi:hypothetical protein